MKNLEGKRFKDAECDEDEHLGMQCRGGDRWRSAVYAKKVQHEERMDKDKRGPSYETYGVRASKGIEFEAILVHDH